MRTRKRHSFFLYVLVLGLGLPGLIGIFAVQAGAGADQSENIQRALMQIVGTFTPTSPSTSAPLPSPTSTGLPLNLSPAVPSISSLNLQAFIQAPNGPVVRPYVILTAFASIPRIRTVTIRGFVNSDEFICTTSPCAIQLPFSSRLVFRAFADTGETSDEVIATVTVSQRDNAYFVNIDTVNQFTFFADSCSREWGVGDQQNATWDNFVQFPYQINTRKTLYLLATQLLLNGVVDASDCPYGGLSLGLDWPTACGLERAADKMIEWQNQYDEYIWLASRDHGIPPKILKSLIEYESQFWPGNSRFYLDEFGLGQINQLGVDVLLRRDPTLFQRVCPSVLLDCTRPYQSLEPGQQALIRGALISLMDATCADCQYGLDFDRAKESISLIAMLLKANCQQVDAIVGGNIRDASYEDLWRFTLSSYHNGVSCFQDAVSETKKAGLPVTWENVQKELKCKGGPEYVNGLMTNVVSFDLYLYQASDALTVLAAPTIVPTRTPVPTPTPFISRAQIRVQVFLDRNGNGLPDDGEGIDSMPVLVALSTGEQFTKRTQNGLAVFDMTGYRPGIGVSVSLPGLYRSENFTLPQQGDVPVLFPFEQPVLPTILP